MSENPRIEALKKRVEKDPTSIAFAQLAEEYRRVGEYQMAVDACRDGLSRHPGYVSARVTLARALMELAQYGEAKHELQSVLSVAPDNLAAIRALADIHQKTGDVEDAFHFAAPAPTPEPAAAELIRPEPIASEPALPDPPLDDLTLPALDLDSPSIDLAPLPDMNWDLDVTPHIEVAAPPEAADPVIGELEGWLDAILADRAHTR